MAHRTIVPLNHLYAEFLNVEYSKSEFQNNLHIHIYEDNKPAIGVLTHKQIQNTKLRNVLAYQFKLREDYDNKSLTVSLCTSAEQLADIFTKTTQSRELFSNIRNFLVRPKNVEWLWPHGPRGENERTSYRLVSCLSLGLLLVVARTCFVIKIMVRIMVKCFDAAPWEHICRSRVSWPIAAG